MATIIPGGNSDIYPVFTFTILDNISAPLTIRNLTDKTLFSLDISAVAGDVIVVDSNNLTCTKNGTNINALRVIGSVWPVIS